ncbi:MAG: LuxR family transcriptional regulator [Alphaproteobacteria bacterium]|nr:MAG: LuxR family transcriptional regulator [Alphaproteobacteria bacterium]
MARYMDRMLKCTTVEDAWSMHTARMAEYGFDRIFYAFTRFRSFGDFGDIQDALILSNHDRAYLDVFLGKGLYKYAPMVRWVSGSSQMWTSWSFADAMRNSPNLSPGEREVLRLNEKFGIIAGYSLRFLETSARNTSGMGLCAQRGMSQSDIDAVWEEYREEIILLCNLFHLKVSTLPHTGQRPPLTDRQREVLQWVADGKTVQETAIIMGLTPQAIEKHLRNARKALDVETTAQAVAKAAAMNQFYLLRGGETGKRSRQ